jgi:parallel beta-helix repeat protein
MPRSIRLQPLPSKEVAVPLLSLAVLTAAAFALGLAQRSLAGNGGPLCPDRTPLAIAAPAAGSAKCQTAIAKEGAKFLKTKTSALSKCLMKSAPGVCPAAADVEKTEQAAQKAAEKIAKACGEDAVQDGLSSSYGELADESSISSCMLSQHNAIAELLVRNATGVYTGDFPGEDNKARGKCVAEAAKRGVDFGLQASSAMSKCIEKQIQAGNAENLAPVCVGSLGKGSFTLPSDEKTAEKLGKLFEIVQGKIAKKCGPGEGSFLPSVFACDGAVTADELADCLACQGWHDAVSFVEHQYAETGTLVTGSIEDAVNAAAAGQKLLIPPGTYAEGVTLEQSGLALVGCGGATNDRPVIVPPEGKGAPTRGIFAAGLDDLLFQSLVVDGFENDGIFVTGGGPKDLSHNITFRDIVGEGRRRSRYAVFPVMSDHVVIEGCRVNAVADAGLYVGQSTDIVLRHNHVTGSVAAIELENSAHGTAHDNYASGNTAGLLAFKDGGLLVQQSDHHRVAHNVFDDNNEPNYGTGTVAGVPTGTGLLVISDDDSVYEYNFVRGNDTFGIAVIDAVIAGLTPAVDQKTERNTIRRNVATGNAGNPDPDAFPADILFVLSEFTSGDPPVQDHGNCFEGNGTDIPTTFIPPQLESQCAEP